MPTVARRKKRHWYVEDRSVWIWLKTGLVAGADDRFDEREKLMKQTIPQD